MISSKSVSRVPSGLDCTISPTHRQRVAGKPGSGGGSMASAGGCLGSHPLHGNLSPGDTLVRNPHRSSKIGRTRNSSNNGNTGNTEKTTMSARSGENAKQNYNNDSSKTAQKATPLARGLSSSGDTGVTSVTALKDNAFFGNTSFSECVTGVTVLKNKGNSAPSQV